MKRRKVGNLLALAILSTLNERPMHPYEMASILKSRGKDRDMGIKWGSFYTVVANLRKHGFIEAVESGRDGARPERTVYRITDAGRDEMLDWLRELLAELAPEEPKFVAGLSVLGWLGPDEVTALFRTRLVALDEDIASTRAELARLLEEIPRLVLLELEYHLAIRVAEAEWVRSILGELTSGSMPGLAEWRALLAERGTTG
ncbi:PadR family transcriptional regulator [Amycolatopsis roodepoortensis]|uniref:DNA-binding PadR family transcriptional regulator n=1 Tax=Amycolatopsis roodepoortensis TaxID=700274 RepID=A0ABR9LKC2_9PSEU|nr:PadR family transcriptional regulator [Amycolatopsis roodepoortensis]MBE1580935.1 DNA-binding PadR family transcriptional regulator [Amycolatopsis roodepoortensis]